MGSIIILTRQLRSWARFRNTPKGLRAFYALLALQAEGGHGPSFAVNLAELGEAIGLNADGAGKALRWLENRGMIQHWTEGKGHHVRIQPEEAWSALEDRA